VLLHRAGPPLHCVQLETGLGLLFVLLAFSGFVGQEDFIQGGAMAKGPKDLISDDRRERTKALAPFVQSPKGTAEYEREQALMNQLWKTPKAREHIKEMQRKAVATIKAQHDSGAGYPSDVALRELQMEYNNRLMKFGVSVRIGYAMIIRTRFHRPFLEAAGGTRQASRHFSMIAASIYGRIMIRHWWPPGRAPYVYPVVQS